MKYSFFPESPMTHLWKTEYNEFLGGFCYREILILCYHYLSLKCTVFIRELGINLSSFLIFLILSCDSFSMYILCGLNYSHVVISFSATLLGEAMTHFRGKTNSEIIEKLESNLNIFYTFLVQFCSFLKEVHHLKCWKVYVFIGRNFSQVLIERMSLFSQPLKRFETCLLALLFYT